MNGSNGRAAAARRFGSKANTAGKDHGTAGSGQRAHSAVAEHAPPGNAKTREWTLEHLFSHPRMPAIARADARLHGNRSAARALADLRREVAAAEADPANADPADYTD